MSPLRRVRGAFDKSHIRVKQFCLALLAFFEGWGSKEATLSLRVRYRKVLLQYFFILNIYYC